MKRVVIRTMGSLMVLAMLFFFAGAAAAQQGLYLGTGLGLAFPRDWEDEFDPNTGANFEFIHLGYNFNDNLGIGIQIGGAAGTVDDTSESSPIGSIDFEDMTWAQAYLTFSGRYTFYNGQRFVPYIEAGLGQYNAIVEGDVEAWIAGNKIKGDIEGDLENTTGFRLAVGGNYYINNLYIAPELSYHFTSYDGGDLEIDVDDGPTYKDDFDDDSHADMLVLQFKIGYHFRQADKKGLFSGLTW